MHHSIGEECAITFKMPLATFRLLKQRNCHECPETAACSPVDHQSYSCFPFHYSSFETVLSQNSPAEDPIAKYFSSPLRLHLRYESRRHRRQFALTFSTVRREFHAENSASKISSSKALSHLCFVSRLSRACVCSRWTALALRIAGRF
jgi:hypothetical protein